MKPVCQSLFRRFFPKTVEKESGKDGKNGLVKSHHNVGGLPEDLKFKLVEPLRFLYKDEVRMVGKTLGLPDNMVYRQPFPNRYLASLSPFCAEHLDDKRIYDLVYDHFTDFVVRNLEQYYQDENDVEIEDTHTLSVGFVGSIAYYYKSVLQQVMDDMGFAISKIMQDPIEGLKEYHRGDAVPTM